MNHLRKLFREHIEHTVEREIVFDTTIHACNLSRVVKKLGYFPSNKVYLTSRMLKHLYDKKPAEEFDFVLNHLVDIIRFPTKIYENKFGRRGNYCLVKTIGSYDYLCSLEYKREINLGGVFEEMIFVVTAFRVRDVDYLKNFTLLWDWKGGTPSS